MEPQDHVGSPLIPSRGATATRAIVIGPYLRGREPRNAAGDGQSVNVVPGSHRANTRSAEARLDEAVGLAQAIDLDIVDRGIVMISAILARDLPRQG